MLRLRWIGYAVLLLAVTGALPATATAQSSPSVDLSLGSGSPGTEVQVTGSGWWAGAPVQLFWESSDGRRLAEADPARRRDPAPGTFSVTFIVPDVAPGAYRISAVGADTEIVRGRGMRAYGSRDELVVFPVTVEAQFLVLPSQQATASAPVE